MNYKIIVSPIASKNIEDALGVFLDFLVRESKSPSFDKRTLQRIQELELLEESKKQTLFDHFYRLFLLIASDQYPAMFPNARCICGQSNPAPGSAFRPAAMCSWPVKCAIG